jgi:bacterioferritin-associated ferredoxin
VIVCQCAVVNDGMVAAAVDAGARTVNQVCRSTGAGRDCGSCVFSLKALLCDHGAQSVRSPDLGRQEAGVAAG